ncbi:MAG: hypothetical protein AAF682_19805 [Planctomycetota bacterium]
MPVPGVRARLALDHRRLVHHGVSDAAGRVVFAEVRAGAAVLDLPFAATKGVQVVAGEERQVEVYSPRPFPVVGRVVGPDGEPVEGAEVCMALRGDRDDDEVLAVSDAWGLFWSEDCVARTFIHARARGYSPSISEFLDEARLEGDVVLELREAKEFSGLVVDTAGSPVADALVLVGDRLDAWAFDADGVTCGRYPTARRTRTDEAGRFVVSDGWVHSRGPVTAIAEGYVTTALEGVNEPQELRLVLAPDVPVRGVVLDPAGTPIADALVSSGNITSWAYAKTWTDAAGGFTLDGIGEAPVVELDASRKGYRRERFSLSRAALEGEVELILQAAP